MADFTFCIENSESIGKDNWNLIIKFVQEVTKLSNVGPDKNHMGIVEFGTLCYWFSLYPLT